MRAPTAAWTLPSLCPSSCSQREQARFLCVLLKCYTALKTQEVWRPKGRVIFLSRRPAAWSSVLLRLKPDNKRSRNRGKYSLDQICVHHGCGVGSVLSMRSTEVCVCGGGSEFHWGHTLTAPGLGFREPLPLLLSTSHCFLTLLPSPTPFSS